MTKVSHPIAALPERGPGQRDDRPAVRAERPWARIPAGATLARGGEVSVTTTDLWRMSAVPGRDAPHVARLRADGALEDGAGIVTPIDPR